MADLVALVSKIKYPGQQFAAVTLKGSGGAYAAQIYPLSRRENPGSDQLWRREASSVLDSSGNDWIGYTFTMPVKGYGRQALTYAKPKEAIAVAKYDASSRMQLWRLAHQAWPYAVLSIYDPNQSQLVNLFGGFPNDGTPIYAWPDAAENAADNEYWDMPYFGEAPGTAEPSVVTVTRRVLCNAKDPGYNELLFSDPAAVFAVAGYTIPLEHHDAFNEFYRSHRGVQAVQAAIANGCAPESLEDFECTICSIACYVVAVAFIVLGVVAVGLLTEGSEPIVALAALVSVKPATALIFAQTVLAVGEFTLQVVITRICGWLGMC